jgi:hypothetical protein
MRAIAVVLSAALAGCASYAADVSFTARPAAARAGDGIKISFSVSTTTDVEVAILSGTKVVRHLAAGMLGATNPPPPPLKPGFAQELVWDGKDDFGKQVYGGPAAAAKPSGENGFQVRVRAGTGVKFGCMVGADPYTFGRINSLATDDEGNLYTTACVGDCNQYAISLKVFSPEGRYLRTLIPFPADLKPDVVANLARWNESRNCYIPRNLQSGNPLTYPFDFSPNAINVVSASRKAGVVLAAGMQRFHLAIDGGTFTGPTPMWSPAAKLKNPGWNTPQLAVSPDGRYIYYANVAGTQYQPKSFADTDANWPQGRVYRQDTTKAGSDPEKFYDLELPDWNQQKYWLPDAWNKRTAAYGIATDAKGNVFICDLVNQQIVEVSPDGKKVSTSKVPWPERVMVNNANGDLYVICRLDKPLDGHVGKKLVKLTGRNDAARIAAEMPLQGQVGEACAVGTTGGQPVLWLAGGDKLLCVADKGATLEVVQTEFKPRGDSQLDWGRIAVDHDRDEVYINNGTSRMYLYDGKTGQGGLLKKNNAPFWCVDMAVAYDGSLYMRTGDGHIGPLERYTHDLAPLPFATGSHQLWDIYSRMGIGFCDKGVGVGPRGECYVSYMYGWNQYFVAGFSGDGKPIKGKYLTEKIKKPDAKSWVSKFPEDRWVTSAVVGPIPAASGGIAVDLQGNLYVGMNLVPKGFTPPAGFEKDPAYGNWAGSVVKFPPSGGTVLGAVKEDDVPGAEGERTACNFGMTVVGALKLYPGIAPFSAGGYGGNGSCCVCRVPRFAVDRYGRLALPNCVTCSVTLMDNAGNAILEFGGYGNFDSQYVNPNLPAGRQGKPTVATPEFPLAWVTGAGFSEDHIYVIDTYDKRALRVDKTWKTEETVRLP